MRFVIVTGMSGAGKSSVLKMLEDAGYYCIDNLPVPLMPKLVELLSEPQSEIEKIALGIDIRNGKNFVEVDQMLQEWRNLGLEIEVLFMEASDKELVKRYKETRRIHPVEGEGRVETSIHRERISMENIKKRATYIIDTSQLLTRELKEEIIKIFIKGESYKNLYVTILSFGFKNGLPSDADLVFDVRFLPNPYYIEELRKKTGNDQEVKDFVLANNKSQEFLVKLQGMIEFLIPSYIQEGKSQLVIAIGCTGGMHRSVTIANELYRILEEDDSCGIRIEHRDIQRENFIKEV